MLITVINARRRVPSSARVFVALLALVSCSSTEDSPHSSGPQEPRTTSTAPVAPTSSTTPPATDLPDPCRLLALEEIVPVLGFMAEPELIPAQADGTPARVCTWAHIDVRHRGGFALLEVLEVAGTAFDDRRAALSDEEEIADLGDGAVLGRSDSGYGDGHNTLLVHIGDDAFQLFVSVYQTLERDELVGLAELVVARWELLGATQATTGVTTGAIG
jgi:hypothetical protein